MMAGTSTLEVQQLAIPTADVGPDNPLPPIFSYRDLHQIDDLAGADPQMRAGIRYGRVGSTLPYLQQDGYGRERRLVEHPVVVLQNENLTATFLPRLGGRLWSLVHRPSGRELLYRNRVVQPANLALRNAWFAGGVEWNIGTIGHSPLTCSPVHAARVDLDDGTPALRMYEYERMRELVYQVDAWLPPGSPVLLVRVRVVNPNDDETPLYWWSNIAVPQDGGTRVIAPADSAWQFTYDSRVRKVSFPVLNGLDRSYPARAVSAADYFFDVDCPQRPWIAALDSDGIGLAQASTRGMRGRKLFLWGEGGGGRHWQQWLSPDGGSYLEIQAGLARTQLEHEPMPPHGERSWVETYGMLQVPAELAHGDDWSAARAATQSGLDRLLPAGRLDLTLTEAAGWADRPVSAVLSHGSGWGALEERLRAAEGECGIRRPGTPFPDTSIGAPQQPWLRLLTEKRLPETAPQDPPAAVVVGPRWSRRLASCTDWVGLLHFGVVQAHAGDPEAARHAWQLSLRQQENAWALRNLAALELTRGHAHEACRMLSRACEIRPRHPQLVQELTDALISGGEPRAALDLLEALPDDLMCRARLRLAQVRAAVCAGDLDRAESALALLAPPADLREGEGVLHETWFEVAALRRARQRHVHVDDAIREEVRQHLRLPWQFEFRMSGDGPPGSDPTEQREIP